MPSITLSYGAGAATSRSFSALSVKGFKPGDAHEVFPRLRPTLIDGRVEKVQVGFRRIFELDLMATAMADIEHIGLWLANESQYLTFSYSLAFTQGSSTEGALTADTLANVGGTHVEVVLDNAHDSWSAGDTVYITGDDALTPVLPTGSYVISSIEGAGGKTFRIAESGYSGSDPSLATVERTINSITETDLQVVDNHPEFAANWIDGVEYGRRFIINCTEKSIMRGSPLSTAYLT